MLRVINSDHKLSTKLSGGLVVIKFLIVHLFTFPKRFLKRKRLFSRILSNETIEQRFTEIYQHNAWGDLESRSGPGSNFASSSAIREQLPRLIERFEITSILDAPCGDYSWMKNVEFKANLSYIGCDIVEPLIIDLQRQFGTNTRKFIHLDITRDKFPDADLLLVRDCLFHFSFEDIFCFLKNFTNSNINYLLTTSHSTKKKHQNRNIKSGDFRVLDLLKSPFNLSSNYLCTIEEPAEGLLPSRKLILWTREEISNNLRKLKL